MKKIANHIILGGNKRLLCSIFIKYEIEYGKIDKEGKQCNEIHYRLIGDISKYRNI